MITLSGNEPYKSPIHFYSNWFPSCTWEPGCISKLNFRTVGEKEIAALKKYCITKSNLVTSLEILG